jgi:hypothetical protein
MLLACIELNLSKKWKGKTAEARAVRNKHKLTHMIVKERRDRERWGALCSAWIVATTSRVAAI